MKKKIIITAVLAAFLIGGAIGYYLYTKPVASITDLQPEVSLSAEELFDRYQVSEEEANNRFLGKVMELEGVVREVRHNDDGDLILVLETSDLLFGVICEFEVTPENGKEPQLGESIVLKGICNGLLMDVVLNKCMITKQA